MHHRRILVLLAAASTLPFIACTSPENEPDEWADGRVPSTLRIDYLHSGSADAESFRLDELILEGPWPGPSDRRIDELDYGPYFFEVRDSASGEALYSRGYASVFGEWQTTAEAHDTTRTFHESVRLPKMKDPAELIIYKRDELQTLHAVWHLAIHPATARPAVPYPDHYVWNVMKNGPASEKVDILMLGDGYTSEEMEKWHADARRLADTLFSYEPFRSRREEFNVRAIDTPSAVSGIARPSEGLTHQTPIGATYDAFGTERYVLTFENKRWHNIAAAAPYEFVLIVANDRKYGGGGIYNAYSTVAADNESFSYVLVHEFGHQFAGLGDEYYTSDVAYVTGERRPEPWSPNVTANGSDPKWRALVDSTTPLPTPWPKAEYEALEAEIQARRAELRSRDSSEAEVEALSAEARRRSDSLLSNAEYAVVVGAFEGANYASTGYYRPQIDCIMFTRNPAGFCRVCSKAVSRMIDQYAGSATDRAARGTNDP